MNTHRLLSRLRLVLAFSSITLGVPAARAADANLTVNYSTVVRTLPADFHGVNYVAFGMPFRAAQAAAKRFADPVALTSFGFREARRPTGLIGPIPMPTAGVQLRQRICGIT